MHPLTSKTTPTEPGASILVVVRKILILYAHIIISTSVKFMLQILYLCMRIIAALEKVTTVCSEKGISHGLGVISTTVCCQKGRREYPVTRISKNPLHPLYPLKLS